MGMILQTMQVSTGNPATVNDKYDALKVNSGAQNPLGASYWAQDSSGRWLKYTYVRLSSTVPPAFFGPQPVYWKDNTFQVVTIVGSEGFNAASAVAGWLLNYGSNPVSTDLATANITDGNYVFIQVSGYLKGAIVPASTAIMDAMIGKVSSATASLTPPGGTAGAHTYTFYADRTAKDTAPTDKVAAWALTAITTGLSDIQIVVDGGF